MARERSRLIAQMDALESEVLELTSARRAAAGTRLGAIDETASTEFQSDMCQKKHQLSTGM
jgi:hypothetical protein